MAAWHFAGLIARMVLSADTINGSVPVTGLQAGSSATKVGDTELQT